MTPLVEPVHAGEHLVSEANGFRSRDVVTIAAGADLSAATVLAKIALGSAVAAVKGGGNTGNGTVSVVSVADAAKVGTYRVIFTAATKFNVEDPDGFNIAKGTVGAAYADDLGFTITAGATPFVADDGFDITVAAGSGKYVPLDPAASDGSQHAAAVLFAPARAALAEVEATVHARAAEVNGLVLIWPDGITADQKAAAIADLAAADVIVRS